MSDVYFSNLRTTYNNNLLDKLRKLIIKAGINTIDFDEKFVAIKMHFGEPGNLAFLRPNWAKVVADVIKEKNGKPFLTDCNTLYVGGRKNALDHLDSAALNGFSPLSTGCQILIADGLKGNDDVDIEINEKNVKEAHIGKAVVESDIIISLNHFKGHESTGFGGALKNIGMGCGSRRVKMDMHYNGKPHIDIIKCINCGICNKICAHDAPTVINGKREIDNIKCVGCGRCLALCPKDAINPTTYSSNDLLNEKIAEYTKAVLKDKPSFHISIVIDVSPNCDCHSENDAAIVPNVGLFASFDPVALDQACADAINKMPVISNTMINTDKHEDHFNHLHPTTDWNYALEYAEKINLGERKYKLITVK